MQPRFAPFRQRSARFLWFAAVSLSVHAAAFVGLGRVAGDRAKAVFDPASQTLEGDTLDLEPRVVATTSPVSSVSLGPPQASSPAVEDDPADKYPGGAASRSGPRAASPREVRRPPPAPAPPPPARFGAVGVRSATDLATAFTRAFPQAASADSLWLAVPFGPAGVANVTLVLDDAGTLASSTVDGALSSPLRRGISRTIALLGTRAFTAQGAITRLRVIAHVTRDDVRDGLHGDVFALSGGSFAGDVGAAFFALPARGGAGAGRRVDILLRLAPDN